MRLRTFNYIAVVGWCVITRLAIVYCAVSVRSDFINSVQSRSGFNLNVKSVKLECELSALCMARREQVVLRIDNNSRGSST